MLKKYVSLIVSAVLVCSFAAGCGNTAEESPTAESAAVSESENMDEENQTSEQTTTTTTAPTTTTTTTAAPTTANVTYITERSVQYNSEKDVYNVMFSIEDENYEPLAVDGTAYIEIMDINDNILYDDYIDFTASDFTSWSSRLRDDSTYGYWLNIPRDYVEGGTSSTGTLALSVFGDEYSFSKELLSISDLPTKEASIILPDTPISIIDMRYHSHTSYASISDLSYDSKNNYDGEMTLTLYLTITLDSKEGEENVADSAAVAYKITDSEGFVAETGTIYSQALRVGEKSKEKEVIYDLDPSETYTVTFENVS